MGNILTGTVRSGVFGRCSRKSKASTNTHFCRLLLRRDAAEQLRKQFGMRKRVLRVAIPVFVVCLVARSVVPLFAASGSLRGGEWKTAPGVSLQLPADGSPKLVFTAQPATGQAVQAGGGGFTVHGGLQENHRTTPDTESRAP